MDTFLSTSGRSSSCSLHAPVPLPLIVTSRAQPTSPGSRVSVCQSFLSSSSFLQKYSSLLYSFFRNQASERMRKRSASACNFEGGPKTAHLSPRPPRGHSLRHKSNGEHVRNVKHLDNRLMI
uniref:Uncharacterized protein n=1 Tax=Caenorhabditis japonica TaxID=281687 RepID=A0A8R1IU46_CAEJA